MRYYILYCRIFFSINLTYAEQQIKLILSASDRKAMTAPEQRPRLNTFSKYIRNGNKPNYIASTPPSVSDTID